MMFRRTVLRSRLRTAKYLSQEDPLQISSQRRPQTVSRPGRNLLLCILCSVAVLHTSPVKAQQQERTAIGALADASGEALRTIVGKNEPEEVAEAVAVEAMDIAAPAMAVKPAKNEIDQRKSRLTGYSTAMQSWISDVCELSEEQ